ncbi:hypothetical protein DASC09_006170 [Saccharomycopsis crataegensis]|uniref:Arrestin-like N-terminal domain-containing protein n=1 Tax=Saccharomycopsis crataegensis TaxID=43959 RepID=A0AAV5QF60_9ASCO|nr:hypothetical protein DASC09_006170 [Saccharomycopsis crataegensis]
MVSSHHSSYKNAIELSLNTIDNEVYLKGLHIFDNEGDSLTALRGSITLKVKKPFYLQHLQSLKISFQGELLTKVFPSHSGEDTKTLKDIVIQDQLDWDLSDINPSSLSSSDTLVYPFQFLVDSKLPETIETYFNKVSYSLTSTLKFHSPKKSLDKPYKEITVTAPIAIMRILHDPSLLEFGNQAIIEGSYKNYFHYSVNFSHKIIYLDDTVDCTVEIVPTSKLFTEHQFCKLKRFQLFLLQNYNPNVGCCPQRSIKKRKLVVAEHKFKSQDWCKSSGSYKFSMQINFQKIQANFYGYYPTFGNSARIAPFTIQHYLRSMFIIEEKLFEDEEVLERLFKTVDSYSSGANTINKGSKRESISSSSSSSSSASTFYSARGSFDSVITCAEELLSSLVSQTKHKMEPTELYFKNSICLLPEDTRFANLPPPNYAPYLKNSHGSGEAGCCCSSKSVQLSNSRHWKKNMWWNRLMTPKINRMEYWKLLCSVYEENNGSCWSKPPSYSMALEL